VLERDMSGSIKLFTSILYYLLFWVDWRFKAFI